PDCSEADSGGVTYSDPFGLCPIPIVCEAIDIGFLVADINDIRKNGWSWGSAISLGADVVATIIPGVPAGAGAAFRASRRLPFADPDRVTEINKTLDRIRDGIRKYPEDGEVFKNREGLLPEKPPGYYTAWTVDTPGLSYRGKRRAVRGAEGELYYTDDHYH